MQKDTVKVELVVLPFKDCLRGAPRFSLNKAGKRLDWIVAHAYMDWFHMQSIGTLVNVAVSVFNVQGKLPYVLQVRALKQFKKSELILYPAGGSFVEEKNGLAADAKKIHESLVFKSEITTRVNGKGKPVPPHSIFTLASPLFAGAGQKNKDACLDGLAPFWAVGRAPPTQQKLVNMETFTHSYDIPTPTSVFGRFHKKISYKCDVKALRNTKIIEEGDVLILGAMDTGDDD